MIYTILRAAGIDPAMVKLVRHQGARATRGRTTNDFWLAKDGRLELYQAIQSKDHFDDAGCLSARA